MGVFREIGRRVERLKRDVEDAAADHARVACPSCDTEVPAGAIECPSCGAGIGTD